MHTSSPLLSNSKHLSPFSLFVPTISSSISMAPKRRRQTGLTRMDAALDQVSCFGFSKQLIRKTVKNLLKLYGDDGWKLIEEDGYRVVLDVILDEQETEQTQNLLTHDASSKQEVTGKELVITEVNEVANEIASFEGNNTASLTTHTGEEKDECCKDIETAHSSTFHDDHSSDKINNHCSKNAPDMSHTPVNVKLEDDHSVDKFSIQCSENAPDVAHALVRRRKPCYGWISDDDDDDDYLCLNTHS